MQNKHGFFSLTLRLGWRCNGRCIYCSVGKFLNPGEEITKVNEDIYRYIANWSQSATFQKPKGLGFYGGEPLLYFETIKEIVEELKRDRNFNTECVRFRIVTNGILLNQEVVDFCNKHSVLVTLSYDAPVIDGLRELYMPDSKIPLFLSLKYRQVQFVYNAINCRPLQSKLFLEKKFPDTQVRCSFYANYGDGPMPRLSCFNKDLMLKGLNEMLSYYRYNEPDLVFQRVFSAVRRLDDFDFDKLSAGHIQCIAGRGIALDMEGNIYMCANCGEKAADIYDGDYEVLRQKCRDDIARRILPACKMCRYLSICRIYCPLAYEYEGRYEHCEYHKILYDFVYQHELELKEIMKRVRYDVTDGYGLQAYKQAEERKG